MSDRKTWVIGGASGLIGTALTARLREAGHRPVRLVRRAGRGADEISWDPGAGSLDAASLEGVDGIVNLAGESLFSLRWTVEKKRRIVESRTSTTGLIGNALARMNRPAPVWVNASAVGIYGGERGDELLSEEATAGDDFLARTCVAWEDAAKVPSSSSPTPTRIVRLRTGVVLSTEGGALSQMLTPFRLGLGGRIGSGRQWMSWIELHDAVSAIAFLLQKPVDGPVNLVSPNPVTNAEFTAALGKALGRPTVIPLPAVAVRVALGEMGEALLLASQRAVPTALLAAGFDFDHPQLDVALVSLLEPNG